MSECLETCFVSIAAAVVQTGGRWVKVMIARKG